MLGIAAAPWCAGILVVGLAAIVTGHLARGEIQAKPYLKGRVMAAWGLGLGYASVVFAVFIHAMWIIDISQQP